VSHQPYERWILGDEPLSAADQAELDHHLAVCRACREIQLAWSAVKPALQAPLDIEIEPGFAARWRELQIRRSLIDSRRQRRVGALAVTGGLAAAALIGAALAWQGLQALFAPATLLTRQMEIVLILVRDLRLVSDLGLAGAQALAGVIPLDVWMTLLAIGAGAVGLWCLALYRLAVQTVR
jgi:hypothetical protein